MLPNRRNSCSWSVPLVSRSHVGSHEALSKGVADRSDRALTKMEVASGGLNNIPSTLHCGAPPCYVTLAGNGPKKKSYASVAPGTLSNADKASKQLLFLRARLTKCILRLLLRHNHVLLFRSRERSLDDRWKNNADEPCRGHPVRWTPHAHSSPSPCEFWQAVRAARP